MLRTNLSTRPFYNERLVHWLLGLAAVLVAAFTIYNLTHFLSLSGRQRTLAEAAARDEAAARALTARAAAIRGAIDPKALQRVTTQAAEANALIDARAFSWTALFNDIESTLPASVMLTSVSPKITEDGVVVRFTVLGRSVEAIDGFIEKLEATGRFFNVLAASETVNDDDGLYQTLIEGGYRQAVPLAAPASPAPAAAGAAAPGTQLAGPPAAGGTR